MNNSNFVVLLVEDDDDIRLSLRDYLKAKGFTVLVSSDGVGAIKILLDAKVDVIVSDYRMDILGGDYWVRFLKTFCPNIDVIITSGYLRQEYTIPYPVLYKPFDYAEIAAMLTEIRDKKQKG
ncbi:response regulator [Gracilinema caldarium]|uniref:Response regulator receiver protein n=1 Tax=Gracilinema caldarium (strain ATCC 51460 / DSM 7334 / H1) TaxID=744872 RepID=F8EYQ8_GRAC1|nr:response regulator [Gracilinema caldarium]AEJ18635.1 response regulator receiver protein [Gracilinema caldarium DSM 7334]